MKATGIAKGVYPINTGKVLIGRDYIPKHTHYTTEAELWTQDLLLRGREKPTSVALASRRFVNALRAVERVLSNLFRRVK